jgi:hypothetical protein
MDTRRERAMDTTTRGSNKRQTWLYLCKLMELPEPIARYRLAKVKAALQRAQRQALRANLRLPRRPGELDIEGDGQGRPTDIQRK